MAEQTPSHHRRATVDYEQVDQAYMEKRQLQGGAAGWVLLAGLGVAYVISGDFAGWNFGLAEGGWGGLLIATILMATMYTCMVFGLAELSSALPTSGGGYTFARRALGPWGGMATGTAILIEYAIAPAAIATFIGGYVESLGLFGITDGWWVYLAVLHPLRRHPPLRRGRGTQADFVITAIAAVALIIFVLGMIPKFDASNLTNIAPTDAAGSSSFLPFGYVGHLGRVPVCDLVLPGDRGRAAGRRGDARPQARHAARPDRRHGRAARLRRARADCRPGRRRLRRAAGSGNPLVEAMEGPLAYDGETAVSQLVNYVGLLGLIASFFSIIYAYSRQTFALSRAGYLPKGVSVTSRRHVPVLALIIPGVIGFLLATTGEGAILSTWPSSGRRSPTC